MWPTRRDGTGKAQSQFTKFTQASGEEGDVACMASSACNVPHTAASCAAAFGSMRSCGTLQVGQLWQLFFAFGGTCRTSASSASTRLFPRHPGVLGSGNARRHRPMRVLPKFAAMPGCSSRDPVTTSTASRARAGPGRMRQTSVKSLGRFAFAKGCIGPLQPIPLAECEQGGAKRPLAHLYRGGPHPCPTSSTRMALDRGRAGEDGEARASGPPRALSERKHPSRCSHIHSGRRVRRRSLEARIPFRSSFCDPIQHCCQHTHMTDCTPA